MRDISRRTVILAENDLANDAANAILSNALPGFEFAGYILTKNGSSPKIVEHNELVLGALKDVATIIHDSDIHEVVVPLNWDNRDGLSAITQPFKELPVSIRVAPDYPSFVYNSMVSKDWHGLPILPLWKPVLSPLQRSIKRIVDVIIALLMLVPGLMIMALASVAVWLDSPGSVMFKQQRVGENGKLFTMYKFRTMRDHADELADAESVARPADTPNHKHANDSRITRVGEFLRRSSFDEIPQLFNILKGDMSVVGPRPELPSLVLQYEMWQYERFAVPQGLTGWWQINGRSDKPMQLNTDLDLHYIRHYSLWLDFKILLKTPYVVLMGKGAY